MSITSKESIYKVLSAYNPWWKTGTTNPLLSKSYKRFAFFDAMERIKNTSIKRTVILTGTRRVGKTTILYQMIEELLKKGIEPRKIVYISMDHPMLKLNAFEDILDCYHENVYPENDVYYFFDEIQYAASWDKWLKTIYDMYPESQIVATGSASPALIKGSTESGAGRWSIISVPTLSFYEYCELLEIEKPNLNEDLKISSFAHLSNLEQADIMNKMSDLQKYFNRYLLVGGFPELALANNDIFAQQIMRDDVVDKVLKRDLPSLYNIRNSTELERIFLYLCSVSSDIISFEKISQVLQGVTRPTVEKYINYLESANLIYQSWPVDLSGQALLKRQPKIYIADAAIRNAVLMDDDILSNSYEMGKVVETAVYKHIRAFYDSKATVVGYFHDNGGKEIDVVIEYPNIKDIFIESKYRNDASITKSDAIYNLVLKSSTSIVVTKKPEDYGIQKTKDGGELIRIPAFAFLYLLGHAEKNGCTKII